MNREVVSMRNLSSLWRGRAPGQLIIQMTDKCNARCPQCEMRVHNPFERRSLTVEQMRSAIHAAAEKGVSALSFTGGEPLLMLDDMAPLIRHAGAVGIKFIRSGTNGYLFKNPDSVQWDTRVKNLADTLAATTIRNFWISIDSVAPEVHERMRGFPGLIKGIEKAIPIFHERGLYPSANLGINRNLGGPETWDIYEKDYPDQEAYLEDFYRGMRSSLRRFYGLVRDLGFTIANTCYPMSIDNDEMRQGLAAVYGATSLDRVIKFSRGEKVALFKALFETVPEFRHQLRIFSPRSGLLSLLRQYVSPDTSRSGYGCRGGIDYFFINSQDGNTYPCGYRGNENLGKFEDLEVHSTNTSKVCKDCDWECFRDPSELTGPLIELRNNPFALVNRILTDREYYRLWMEDLRYYRACDFFNGRRDMDMAKLAVFAKKEWPIPAAETVPVPASA